MNIDLDGLEAYDPQGLLWYELGKIQQVVTDAFENVKDVFSTSTQAAGNYLSNTKFVFEAKSSIGLQAGAKIDVKMGSNVTKAKAEAKVNLVAVTIVNPKITISKKDGVKDETISIKEAVKIDQELSVGVQLSNVLKIKSGVKQEFIAGPYPSSAMLQYSHNEKFTSSYEAKIFNYYGAGREYVEYRNFYDENNQPLPDRTEVNTFFKPDVGKVFGFDFDVSLIY